MARLSLVTAVVGSVVLASGGLAAVSIGQELAATSWSTLSDRLTADMARRRWWTLGRSAPIFEAVLPHVAAIDDGEGCVLFLLADSKEGGRVLFEGLHHLLPRLHTMPIVMTPSIELNVPQRAVEKPTFVLDVTDGAAWVPAADRLDVLDESSDPERPFRLWRFVR